MLVWNAKTLVERVDTLERNQIRIMIVLGIPPVAGHTLEIGEKKPVLAACESINEIKPVATP